MVVGRAGLGSRGKRVHFRTLDGTASYVEVSMADFTPEKVTDLINQAVEKLYSVHALRGPLVS